MKLKKFKERDNKKVGVIVFTLVCLFLISGAILYRTFAIFEVRTNQNVIKGTVQGMGDIEFAFYIDDKIVKTAPKEEEKEKYVFDEEKSNCTNNATVYWDYQVWGPTVSNLTQTKTKCYLKFKTEYSEEILNGAVPQIKGELTPVILEDDGTVKRADITKTDDPWYNYGNQKWANAVITGNSYELLGSNVHGAEKQDGYVHLDGENDYIDLGLAGYDFKNQFTLSVTFIINAFPSDNPSVLTNTEGAGVGINIRQRDNKYYVGTEFAQSSPSYIYLLSNTEILCGQEYNVILKFDNGTLQMYVNGKMEQEATLLTNYIITGTPFLLGANPQGDSSIIHPANIDIKQAAIFNRAIGEDEITNISKNFKITNGKGLLKYVDFTNKKYEAGEVISEDNIESYFVWIPRYKYQIWNGEEETSKFTSVVENLGEISNSNEQEKLNQQKEIKIEFENKYKPVSNGNLKNQWLTHPAFTSFDSNGFWAGKFETGYKGATSTEEAQNIENTNKVDTSKVIIKPNVYSWRNVNVSNAFYTSQSYKSNLESHMMKNMEWGAVAYLTNSKYGRCNGNCTEVRINNSSSYVTGSSAVNVPTTGFVNYHDTGSNEPEKDLENVLNYKNKSSVISSTTNNYYGIYDMSGGTWEYVMGVIKDNNDELSFFISSDFISIPESKYYDSYDYSDSMQEYTRGHLGDGTKEFGPFYEGTYSNHRRQLVSWNADLAFFVSSSGPWFLRGGEFDYGTDSGSASFASAKNYVANYITFRIVLTP